MPEPERCQPPPLTLLGRAWRLVFCLAVSALSWGEMFAAQWRQARALFWIDLAVGLACLVAVQLHRRWTFGVALGTNLATLISASAAGPAALAFVSFATQRRLPRIALVGAVSIVSGQLFYYFEPNPNDDPPWVNFTVVFVATVAMAAIGMYIGSRRELVVTLRERARQAEEQQALRVEQARSAERERIAREMHDVLAHRMSLVAMHAGALAFRTDLTPEQVRETAGTIQTASHEALADLRQVLGMLRDQEVPSAPQPTMGDLPAFIEEAIANGMQIDFGTGLASDPPDQVGRAVYRIVQEALTNARKHGGGAQVRVRLYGSPDRGIELSVSNGKRFGGRPAAPGSGLGLVGLRERAELNGGHIDVVETSDRFTLNGWLPWRT